MEQSIDTFLTEAGLAFERAARAEIEALRAERLEKTTFSAIVSASEGPIGKAEHQARCNERYIAAAEAAIKAKLEATLAKADAEIYRLRFEAWRTRAANRRAEMNLR